MDNNASREAFKRVVKETTHDAIEIDGVVYVPAALLEKYHSEGYQAAAHQQQPADVVADARDVIEHLLAHGTFDRPEVSRKRGNAMLATLDHALTHQPAEARGDVDFNTWYEENVSACNSPEHREYNENHAVFGSDVKAAWDAAKSALSPDAERNE